MDQHLRGNQFMNNRNPALKRRPTLVNVCFPFKRVLRIERPQAYLIDLTIRFQAHGLTKVLQHILQEMGWPSLSIKHSLGP